MSPDEQAAALEAMAPEKQIQQPVHSEAEVDIEEWSDVATVSEEPIQEPVHSERAIGALHSQMHAEAEADVVESSDVATVIEEVQVPIQEPAEPVKPNASVISGLGDRRNSAKKKFLLRACSPVRRATSTPRP